MRLNHELQVELGKRLATLAAERASDHTNQELPVLDNWVVALILLASVIAVYCIR